MSRDFGPFIRAWAPATTLARPFSALVFLALALLAHPARARAQGTVIEGTDPQDVEARLHFELGRRHYDRGEYVDAERELLAALRFRDHPLLRYNLYIVYRDSHQVGPAAEQLRLYLPSVSDAQERSRLEGRLRAMEAELARSSSAPPTNGTEEHHEPPIAPVSSSVEPAPWIVLGVGAAALAASVVTGVLALDANAELDRLCDATGCPSGHDAVEQRGATLAITTDVLWIGGAVIAATGLVWGLVSPGAAPVRPTAWCGPDACGGAVHGTF